MNPDKPINADWVTTMLLVLYVFGCTSVWGINPYHDRSYIKFDVNLGLTQNTVSSIVQDKQGRLWVGTGNGLNCYNGYEMLRYFSNGSVTQPLPGNRIRSVCVDDANVVWLGTSSGVGKVNQLEGTIEAVNTNTPLPETMVLFENNGKLIVLSGQEGLCSVDIKSRIVEVLLPHPYPFNGVLCWERYGNEVVVSWNDDWLLRISKDGNVRKWKKLPPGIKVSGFTVRANRLLLFSSIGILEAQDGVTGFKKILLPAELKGNVTAGVFQSKEVLLIALGGVGVYSYNFITGHILAEYTLSTGDPDLQIVKCMFQDEHENVWIGTDGAGLIKLNQKRCRFYPLTRRVNGHEETLPCFTRTILEDAKQQLVLGTLHDGVCIVDRVTGKQTLINLLNGVDKNPQVLCMERLGSKGKLLAGTKNGLFLINPVTGTSKVIEQEHAIAAMCRINDTLMLMSFSDIAELRLYTVKDDVLTRGQRVLDSLQMSLSRLVLKPNKREILLCGTSVGVTQISLDDLLLISGKDMEFDFLTVKINDVIFFNNGEMVLASSAGLLRTDPHLNLINELNRGSGLPDDYINVLLPDKHGYFWSTTNLGVLKVKSDLSYFRGFNRTDGIHELEFNTGLPARLSDGKVAFGTVAGVVLFNPDEAIENEPHAYPRMSEFVVNGSRRILSGFNDKFTFNYLESSFQFNVYSTDFTTPENNLFSFYLEGGDQVWSAPSSGRSVWYQHLLAGKYELKAKCINSAGVWGPAVTLLRFDIEPPFWGTTWFKLVAAVVLLTLIVVVSALLFSLRLRRALARERRAKQIENIRSGISRNIHDEIGAGLSRIALMSSLAKRTKDQQRLDDYHEKLLQTSQDLTKNLGEIVWAVNPKHDNLSSLVVYIRDYVYEALEDTGILPEIVIPDHLPEYPISPDFRNHLFMTIKEALNNVIKHSKAGTFRFQLTFDRNVLSVAMSDDGQGYTESNLRTFGNGLQNMKVRMEEIGADCHMDSAPGRGTTIRISVKL